MEPNQNGLPTLIELEAMFWAAVLNLELCEISVKFCEAGGHTTPAMREKLERTHNEAASRQH